MAILYITMGIPGSGKSTYCREKINNCVYLSRDEVRFAMLTEDDDYFAKEPMVYSRWISLINTFLGQGMSVIADATNLTKKARRRLINQLEYNVEIVYLNFSTSIEECVRRNSLRAGRALVPENVIYDMAARFEEPEYNEDKQISTILTIYENGKVECK